LTITRKGRKKSVLTTARIASSESLLDMPLRYMDIPKEKEKYLQAGKIFKNTIKRDTIVTNLNNKLACSYCSM
jgi:hypothetical protein